LFPRIVQESVVRRMDLSDSGRGSREAEGKCEVTQMEEKEQESRVFVSYELSAVPAAPASNQLQLIVTMRGIHIPHSPIATKIRSAIEGKFLMSIGGVKGVEMDKFDNPVCSCSWVNELCVSPTITRSKYLILKVDF